MERKITSKSVLHRLGVNKSYSGFNYILYALELISKDENYLICITKILYLDIAQKFSTSPICVERNIRRVADVIWRAPSNRILIIEIFGEQYADRRPSNKEFLELLSEYLDTCHFFQTTGAHNHLICPITQQPCHACKEN